MHTLGKVFLGLTLVCAIGAAVLTTQLINIRNSWMKQVGTATTRIAENDTQLAAKQRELAGLRDELVRRRLTWDRVAVAASARPDADGRVTIGFGTGPRIDAPAADQAAPIVHAFARDPAGPLYIGPFRVASVRDAQALLEPLFSILPDDPQTWPAQDWHLWQAIPTEGPNRVDTLVNEILARTEARDSRQATLALQTQAAAQAATHLEGRRKELFGDPQAPKLDNAPEIAAGLVVALRDAGSDRNTALADLDRLRHQVDAAYTKLTETIEANRTLVRSLPGGRGTQDVSAR